MAERLPGKGEVPSSNPTSTECGSQGSLCEEPASLWTLTCPVCPSPGYADHMALGQFRRRFQALDPPLMKQISASTEGVDERKVGEAGAGALAAPMGPEVPVPRECSERQPRGLCTSRVTLSSPLCTAGTSGCPSRVT